MQKSLGGERIGSGNKMKVDLHGYERSTHDLGYVFRSTQSAGTLIPFLVEPALPGDTFDITLDAKVLTHPTIGPLFGSYKLQLDIFECPIRLYQGLLHNNKLGIGRDMSQVKLPVQRLFAYPSDRVLAPDIDNSQINPSCILKYLGISGIVYNITNAAKSRDFNAIPWLAYWDIYKNYYANKQENLGVVVHTPKPTIQYTVDDIIINTTTLPSIAQPATVAPMKQGDALAINFTAVQPNPSQIIIYTIPGGVITLSDLAETPFVLSSPGVLTSTYNFARWGNMIATNWDYINANQLAPGQPELVEFPLTNLDDMREAILTNLTSSPFVTNTQLYEPYVFICPAAPDPDYNPLLMSQEGLAIKTYQSDIFNNWLSTEWIDGVGGINEITAISTAGGSFQLDALYLSNKLYQVLNRIVVSGGSYDDWLDAVYTHERYVRCETPMYHGGLIKELVFQEVVSNSSATSGETGTQPLGTLAGKGTLSQKHKGGTVRIKVNEPSYLIGLVSLTPRIDYSQGNRWFTYSIMTMDDLHKPALDQIGFQDLKTENMAWWSNYWNGTVMTTPSAGKQTGWIHYQTNFNRTYGNFAIETNEMFMTLNRRYEAAYDTTGDQHAYINDLTTYIDPVKFNNIFAQTSLDAQNFWTQIGVDITARRKMSAKIMPNL